jgi:hypothetical protein
MKVTIAAAVLALAATAALAEPLPVASDYVSAPTLDI